MGEDWEHRRKGARKKRMKKFKDLKFKDLKFIMYILKLITLNF